MVHSSMRSEHTHPRLIQSITRGGETVFSGCESLGFWRTHVPVPEYQGERLDLSSLNSGQPWLISLTGDKEHRVPSPCQTL